MSLLIALTLQIQPLFAPPAPQELYGGQEPTKPESRPAEPPVECRCDHAVSAIWCEVCAPHLSKHVPVAFDPLPEVVNEGDVVTLHWIALPQVTTIVGYVTVKRTPLGGHSRGTQKIVFAPSVCAADGHFDWRVPWLDGLHGTLVAKAYTGNGGLGYKITHEFDFRPWGIETEDAIYVHLSNTKRQRLYLQRGGKLVFAALCSGGSAGRMRWTRGGSRGRHDYGGWFRITQKDPHHVSTLDSRWYMPYSLRFYGPRHIHGTSPNQYHKLGRPASHGCVRLHRTDAKALYQKVSVGERVYMF